MIGVSYQLVKTEVEARLSAETVETFRRRQTGVIGFEFRIRHASLACETWTTSVVPEAKPARTGPKAEVPHLTEALIEPQRGSVRAPLSEKASVPTEPGLAQRRCHADEPGRPRALGSASRDWLESHRPELALKLRRYRLAGQFRPDRANSSHHAVRAWPTSHARFLRSGSPCCSLPNKAVGRLCHPRQRSKLNRLHFHGGS